MGKRFGVLLAAPDSAYVHNTHGGYFNLFLCLLADPGETWEPFRVYDGHFPSLHDLHSYHAFVITGSMRDAHGSDDWISKLCQFLRIVHSMRIKLLGICFGHQVLSRALGGRTGRASAGWDIGIRRITLSPALQAMYPGLEAVPSSLNLIECHRDQVKQVPWGAEVLASSEKTGIEMFAMGKHILGIQGHPEYTADILLYFLDRLRDEQFISEEMGERTRKCVKEFGQATADKEIWQKICKSFLKAEPDAYLAYPMSSYVCIGKIGVSMGYARPLRSVPIESLKDP